MTILIDMSQIIISNIAMSQQAAKHAQVEVDDSFIKHMILNSLRLYNTKFKREFGEMIICCDAKDIWRKKIFPQYKASRKAAKENSPIDWSIVYRALKEMVADLREHFPYKVLTVDGCEADDIIATLAREIKEPNMIVSADKDMAQLLVYPHVKQFNPIAKKYIEVADPVAFLKEQIIRGDISDGVPNILSDDDAITNTSKRQKSVYDKKVVLWLNKEPEEFCESSSVLKNHARNTTLIDLTNTPQELQDDIMAKYKIPATGNKQTIIKYFMEHRMRMLLDCIEQF